MIGHRASGQSSVGAGVSFQTTYATPQGDSADRQTVLVVVSHLFVSEIVVSILALHAL